LSRIGFTADRPYGAHAGVSGATAARDLIPGIIEEERRLLYVAHGQSHSDNHLYALRSRFIPASMVGEFNECTWLSLAQSDHSVRRSGGVAVDLTARMRGKWRNNGT